MRILQSASEFREIFKVSPEQATQMTENRVFRDKSGDVSVYTGGIMRPFNKGEIGKAGYS